jgi:hypothetical protein
MTTRPKDDMIYIGSAVLLNAIGTMYYRKCMVLSGAVFGDYS